MTQRIQRLILILTIMLFSALILGAGTVAADEEPESDYQLEFPHTSDHYPGDMNEQNGSMHHFASVGEEFAESEGVPEGFEEIHYVGIRNAEFDFSACTSENTAVFGLDRGNNNSGTKVDEDLLQHRSDTKFGTEELVVEFFTSEDFGGEPIDIRPEDAIVAVLGAGSAGGPCYTMPDDPGWYRMHGWANGTTSDGEFAEIELKSNYQYICDCDSEAEAREELGAPPNERDDSAETPTPEGTETPTPEGTETPTPEGTETPTPEGTETPTPADTATPTPEGTATPTPTGTADHAAGDQQEAVTPTPGDGPGFGFVVAVVGLLVAVGLRRTR